MPYARLIHQHLAQHCPEPMAKMRCSVAALCLSPNVGKFQLNDTQTG